MDFRGDTSSSGQTYFVEGWFDNVVLSNLADGDPLVDFDENWEKGLDSGIWQVVTPPTFSLMPDSNRVMSFGNAGLNKGIWTRKPVLWEPGSALEFSFMTHRSGEPRRSNFDVLRVGLCTENELGEFQLSGQAEYYLATNIWVETQNNSDLFGQTINMMTRNDTDR